jgi:hypothetical protein
MIITKQTSTVEIVKAIRAGEKLQCPICSATLKTVPENWQAGMPLHGIECPHSQRHFMIHCEDATAMKEMRARIKEITRKS